MLVQALAAAAGIAIDNARLYEQSKVRQSWIEATRDIATELLSGTDPARVFRQIADESRSVSGAGLTLVAVPLDPDVPVSEQNDLVVAAAAGEGPGSTLHTIPMAGTAVGAAFVGEHRDDSKASSSHRARTSEPARRLCCHCARRMSVAGVLVALRPIGAQPFSAEQLDMMAAFADQAALAWQLASDAAPDART